TTRSDASTEAINLKMIQRVDLCAESILDKATHTALYKFNNLARAWEKTEVDGAMFIYKRADHPIYSLMIANRQSPEDLIEPILPKIRVKMDKPYLFFCKDDGEIRGLWFYQEQDCERIYALLNKIILELRQEAKVSPPPKAAADNTVAPPGGFLSLLMGGGAPASPAATALPPSPLSPAITLKQAAPVRPVKQHPLPQTSYVKPQQPTAAAEVPSMLQKLMAEQLPPSLAPTSSAAAAAATPGPLSAADLERDLLRQSRVAELMNPVGSGGGMNVSASAASLANFSTASQVGSDPGDIAELESMAGAMSICVEPSEGGGGTRVPLSPTGSSTLTRATGLDRNQLAMGLIQLLQTDDEFLIKVHQAYVEALNRRMGA
ncbi:hypothetical protein PFISCL1PPCAC_13901, partial [Pristionchus fissidentatus]